MGPRGSKGANGNEMHIIFVYEPRFYSGEGFGPWASCLNIELKSSMEVGKFRSNQ
jgi:hypothetical protein